ncbi:MAG: ABC transporter permease subunit [Solirubrobacterales bacterium]|nr:ABC transporter permease subunit [Solirubrobacterales bacterium]
MSFLEYLDSRSDIVVQLTVEHAEVVALSILIATVIGVALGVATYERDRASRLTLAICAIFLTIPSLALFALLIPQLGIGYLPTVVGLVLYALLPIVRNTITGLRQVDAAVVESARGMGMGRWRRLRRIELPLAWPVILTGIRVSTLITLGIAAIAAVINGPGLGELIFSGLSRIGAVNDVNEILTGVLGVMVLALLFDLAFFVLRRVTTSPGVRA